MSMFSHIIVHTLFSRHHFSLTLRITFIKEDHFCAVQIATTSLVVYVYSKKIILLFMKRPSLLEFSISGDVMALNWSNTDA